MTDLMKCPNCKENIDSLLPVCPECGEVLSVDEDTMDAMVKAASVPNLATLFQRGKDRGLIKAGTEYGSAT